MALSLVFAYLSFQTIFYVNLYKITVSWQLYKLSGQPNIFA